MPDTWLDSLKDIPDPYGFAAVKQLCASRKYPPGISDIREMAFCLADGDVVPPQPWESLSRVLNGAQLGKLERQALALVGTEWDLKRSDHAGIARAQYLKAYGELVTSDRQRRIAPEEVKVLAISNRPPEVTPVERQIEARREPTKADPEEVSSMLRDAGF